mmetsp:Transcript_2282/g.4119  ORF Transcript_2282/g.4119 Transcript_2282/m.4119 type:complete len:81 (-) Transcript_2282:156-398(-)|eukprot:CAMPEP_0184696824 /NCGR_PEP_ID=MMETSP0313-20130426/4003_1 /TAXON_ID=2792 /ORGANISM="Porphyridium aerugineum, Strain SAG 1380-2" /LENGTH=80 /DNA_ID=CAMNT_0027155537 /DNA_START=514 /DNA_END=756 /DNA_ORIENTATION=+
MTVMQAILDTGLFGSSMIGPLEGTFGAPEAARTGAALLVPRSAFADSISVSNDRFRNLSSITDDFPGSRAHEVMRKKFPR